MAHDSQQSVLWALVEKVAERLEKGFQWDTAELAFKLVVAQRWELGQQQLARDSPRCFMCQNQVCQKCNRIRQRAHKDDKLLISFDLAHLISGRVSSLSCECGKQLQLLASIVALEQVSAKKLVKLKKLTEKLSFGDF